MRIEQNKPNRVLKTLIVLALPWGTSLWPEQLAPDSV